jgi:hypothetical protein
VVGANEPMPSVSKKLVTKPSASWNTLGRPTRLRSAEALVMRMMVGNVFALAREARRVPSIACRAAF